MTLTQECVLIHGTSLVGGAGWGTPVFIQPEWFHEIHQTTSFEDTEKEIQRLIATLKSTQDQLERLHKDFERDNLREETKIIAAQLAILKDDHILAALRKNIVKGSLSVEKALLKVKQELKGQFSKNTRHMRRTFELVEDIFVRIFSEVHAHHNTQEPITHSTLIDSVLVTEMLWPSRATELLQKGFKAIVTKQGGRMSHAALLARSKGIPFVTNLHPHDWEQILQAKQLLVDGYKAHIIINPTPDSLAECKKNPHQGGRSKRIFSSLSTPDGHPVTVLASIEYSNTLRKQDIQIADGIGLYRSEYLVQEVGCLPHEEIQTQVFSRLLEISHNKTVIIRVFDFSGDKQWIGVDPSSHMFQKHPRFLSRLLSSPSLFFPHMRAILRAALIGHISILFPMIASMQDIRRCRKMVHAARLSIAQETSMFPEVHIGAMVELPSIVCQLRELLREVDFISLGTNDLVQYCLAINRLGAISCDRSVYLHEGFLSLLQYIATVCKEEKKTCIVCGEMPSDPGMLMLLLGLGFTSFTLPIGLIPAAKKTLSKVRMDEAQEWVKECLSFSTQQERLQWLETWKNQHEKMF